MCCVNRPQLVAKSEIILWLTQFTSNNCPSVQGLNHILISQHLSICWNERFVWQMHSWQKLEHQKYLFQYSASVFCKIWCDSENLVQEILFNLDKYISQFEQIHLVPAQISSVLQNMMWFRKCGATLGQDYFCESCDISALRQKKGKELLFRVHRTWTESLRPQ